MSDLLKKWEDALKEKLQQKGQYETALNQLTAEILQLKGGIQFAKDTLEVNSEESFEESSAENS